GPRAARSGHSSVADGRVDPVTGARSSTTTRYGGGGEVLRGSGASPGNPGEHLQHVFVVPAGGPAHAHLAGAVARRIGAEDSPALLVPGDLGGLVLGGAVGQLGVQHAAVPGEAAASPRGG